MTGPITHLTRLVPLIPPGDLTGALQERLWTSRWREIVLSPRPEHGIGRWLDSWTDDIAACR